jgi:hypothetical protein
LNLTEAIENFYLNFPDQSNFTYYFNDTASENSTSTDDDQDEGDTSSNSTSTNTTSN